MLNLSAGAGLEHEGFCRVSAFSPQTTAARPAGSDCEMLAGSRAESSGPGRISPWQDQPFALYMGNHSQGAPQLLANGGALPWGVVDALCRTWSPNAACRGVPVLRVEVTPVCQLGF